MNRRAESLRQLKDYRIEIDEASRKIQDYRIEIEKLEAERKVLIDKLYQERSIR